jgi:hypothetical protein
MPLAQGHSRADLSKNIATEVRAGKKPNVAAAIAYSVAAKSPHQHSRECRETGGCEFKQAIESLRSGGMA